MEPGPGGGRAALRGRREAGAARRPSVLLSVAAPRPAGSWAGKEEAAGQKPPEAGEGAAVATPRLEVPGLQVVVLVVAARAALPPNAATSGRTTLVRRRR